MKITSIITLTMMIIFIVLASYAGITFYNEWKTSQLNMIESMEKIKKDMHDEIKVISTNLKELDMRLKIVSDNLGTVDEGLVASSTALKTLSDKITNQWKTINLTMTKQITEMGFVLKPGVK